MVAAESDDEAAFSGNVPVECCVTWRLSEGAAREVEAGEKAAVGRRWLALYKGRWRDAKPTRHRMRADSGWSSQCWGPLGMKTMPPRLFLGADPRGWPRTGQGEPLRGEAGRLGKVKVEAGETQAAVQCCTADEVCCASAPDQSLRIR